MRRTTAAIGACVCLAALATLALAQKPSSGRTSSTSSLPPSNYSRAPASMGGPRPGLPGQAPDAEYRVHELVEQWKAAGNDSGRDKVEQELKEVLKGQFQARLGAQQKEIEGLEAQVKQLRERLELRRRKQDDIVVLRLLQLLQEAQGLGWGTESGAASMGSAPMGGMPMGGMPGMPGMSMPGGVPAGPFSGAKTAKTRSLLDSRASDPRSGRNNLGLIALAMMMYHDEHGYLPHAVLYGPDGKTPYSWRVALLPFLGQKALYDQYRFNEPWDSQHNRKLATADSVYHSPKQPRGSPNSAYFVLTGPGSIFEIKEGAPYLHIADVTSNKILIVEAKRDIPWTKPEDIAYEANQPLPKLGGFYEGGFHIAFDDGSVHFLSEDVSEKIFHAWITRSGGEVVPDSQRARWLGPPRLDLPKNGPVSPPAAQEEKVNGPDSQPEKTRPR